MHANRERNGYKYDHTSIVQSSSYTGGMHSLILPSAAQHTLSLLPLLPFTVSVCDLAIIVSSIVTRAVGRKLPVIKHLARAYLRVASATEYSQRQILSQWL